MRPGRPRHGRIPPQLPAGIVVVGLCLTGILLWMHDAHGDPDHLVVSGSIEGESARIGSKVGGRLATLDVKEGDAVTAGQVVATFDVPDLEAQQQQLLAAKDQAQAQLEKLQHGPRDVDLAQARSQVDTAKANYADLAAGSRKEDIAAAKANWQQAEVNYNLAVADLGRTRELFEKDVVPRNQLDAAQAKVDSLRKAADQAKEQYEKAENGPRDTQLDIALAQVRAAQASYAVVKAGSRPEDIKAAEDQVGNIDAQLEQLAVKLDEAQVHVPAAGVVMTVLNQPGDIVQPNMPLLEILLDGSEYVQVFIPENKQSWAQPGTQAHLSLDTYPGEVFTGQVTYLSTEGEFTPRNLQTKEKRVEEVYRCKVKLDDAGHKLHPGMVCDVTFSRPEGAK
jgi:multidrug resistance efflux pump